MTISFEDPGYNWLPVGAFSAVVLLVLIAALVSHLFEKYGDPRGYAGWYEGPSWWMTVLAAPIAAGLLLLVGVPWGSIDYGNRVKEAKTVALYDAGFDAVQYLRGRDEPKDGFAANKDGEFFKGALVRDPNAEAYTYRILDWTGQDK